MRVIAGIAKRLALKTVPGLDTRPTTDRTKETLFNMIGCYMADCSFLDLFSGSGAIGIEALSRGAREVIFVEDNNEAVACIKENLEFTKLVEGAQVMKSLVMSALQKLEGRQAFDCIFMDPPYNKELEKEVLTYLVNSSLLNDDTLIIIEASLQTDFSYLEELGYELRKQKKYKTNQHVVIQKGLTE